MKNTSFLIPAAVGICAISLPAMAQDEVEQEANRPIPSSFTLSSGVSYSSGDYGEVEATEVIAVPISASFRRGGLKLRFSIPWIHIDGPGSLLSTPEGRDVTFGSDGGSGGSNSGSGSSNSGSGTGGDIEVEDEFEDEVLDDDDITDEDGFAALDNQRSGFGDVNVALTYSLELGESTWLEPTVKVKLPTASRTRRLGSGEVDVTVGAELVQEFDALTLYGGGRRKFAGKPTGSTIRSTWAAGGGASVSLGDGFALGGDYSWQQSAFAGRQASSEVTGWASTRLGSGLRVTGYIGTGLNSNSADVFGGMSVSRRF